MLDVVTRGLGSTSEYATSVVRLFSGYADSVIWFSSPVAYEHTRLEHDLVVDLRSWDATYYAGLTSDYEWRSPDAAARYFRAGARLARRVAEQIGDDFQVQYDQGDTHRRVRAAGRARNEQAASAFHEMAEHAIAEWARIREVVERAERKRDTLYWSAGP
ncbi:MAG: hypothetical protein ACRYG2_07245 [Janthinobacterium lividum]